MGGVMPGEAVQRGGSLKVNRRKVGEKKDQINVMEINIHTENNILISSTKMKVQF